MSKKIEIYDTHLTKQYKYLYFLAMLSAVSLSTSTVLGYKAVNLFGITEYGTTILFPITYFFQDVITEVYGYRISRHLIWGGLICSIISASMLVFVVHLPPPKNWKLQAEYNVVLDPMLRVAFASVIGIILSSFINIYAIAKWKIIYHGKYFWLRSLTSTAIGEFVLTASSVLIGFIGRASLKEIASIILFAYLFKLIYSTFAVYPATLLVNFLKMKEKIDVYDYDTNFNPFKTYIN